MAAFATLAIYVARWLTLYHYPWDWSPDEGMTLDYARRILEDPAGLYPRSAVPFPLAYGPVLPLLLAPVVAHAANPLGAARVIALAWTALGGAAVFALVRKRGSVLLGVASSALHLAPLGVSFWHVLVRVDGLMIALWLASAVALLPQRLEAGADVLSARRTVAGATLLLASVLTKPTAVIHGLPLVVGWWFVDRRSAIRLALAVGGGGIAALASLQWLTAGGFLWVNGLWAVHPSVPGLRLLIAAYMIEHAGLVLLLALAGAWRATRLAAPVWQESSILLLVGGLLITPSMSKQGAYWNYLMPFLAAVVVFSGRVWSEPARGTRERPPRPLGAVVTAAVALALATASTFPLPDAEDEKTARVFYSFVRTFTSMAGGPILVSRPDLAYFESHQPVEIEGSSFPHLFAARIVGTRVVLHKVQSGTYTLVAWTWPLPSEVEDALPLRYEQIGGCHLAWYFSAMDVHLWARRDFGVRFLPPVGTRCGLAHPASILSPAGAK